MGEIFEYYYKKWSRNMKRQVKPSTYAMYCNLAERHILPAFGQLLPEQITNERLEEFIQEKLRIGRVDQMGGLSPSTVKIILNILKSVLRMERKEEKLACSLEETEMKVLVRPPEIRILTSEEQKKIEEYIYAHPSTSTLGMLISLHMGLRIGEICGLRWESINLAEKTMEIRNSAQRIQEVTEQEKMKTRLIVDTPKSSASIRDLPIPDMLAQQLEGVKGKGFFLNGEMMKVPDPRTYQYQFHALLKKLEIRSYKFHVLRHTFATRCIEAGCDAKTLSQILGHSSVNITLSRYVHPSMDRKREQLELLQKYLNHK